MLPDHLVQDFAHTFTSGHCRLNQSVEVILMQSGIHLDQSDLPSAGQKRQSQRAHSSALLCVAKIGKRGFIHEAHCAGAHIVPHRDPCVDHCQRGGVHTNAVVPPVGLKNLE